MSCWVDYEQFSVLRLRKWIGGRNDGAATVGGVYSFFSLVSLELTRTLPITIKLAPNHHWSANGSEKSAYPSTAVRQKLAALLMTVTVAEDLDRLRALVKRVHMAALQMKMSPKQTALTATTAELVSPSFARKREVQ